MADGIGSLLENKLFLQLLSGAGASIAGEDSVAAQAINPIVQQNISSQNYAGLLKKILGGGGKMTIDKDKFSLTGASELLGGDRVQSGDPASEGFGGTQAGVEQRTTPAVPTAPTTTPQKGGFDFLTNLLNPSSSPLGDISAADLAGLTPEMITQALQLKQAQDVTRQRSISDIRTQLFREKSLSLEERKAKSAESLRQQEIDIKSKTLDLKGKIKKSPLEVPGLGVVSLEEWKALDTKTKAYSYYAFDAKTKGEEVLPYDEWSQQTDEPTAKQIFDIAKDDPEFKDFYFEAKRAGAIKIGEITERKEAVADIAAVKYFSDPKGLVQDVDKFINTEDVQNKLFALEPGQREQESVREKEKFITGKIISAGGEITESRLDGRTFVWTVKWPNGKTSEVRYAN